MSEGWYERGRRKLAESGKRVFQAKTELLSPVKLETRVVKPELTGIIELANEKQVAAGLLAALKSACCYA
jgi:hypothetical protein